MKVKVYVEGGGDSASLKTRCREGFSKFFQRAGLEGRMPRVIACGSRNSAYGDFCTALRSARPGDFPVLLVDSEAAVAAIPWEHLRARDNWDKPPGADDDQAQLMVQCMESWFLADAELLAGFFGQGFAASALPGNPNVEQVPKQQVFDTLKMATRHCRPKGEYGKAAHSFELLARLDPARISTLVHGRRLIEMLMRQCSR